MTLGDDSTQFRTANDQVVFLLGELKGEMRATREVFATAQAAQSEVNAENKREHEEFRSSISGLQGDVVRLTTAQPVKVSLWSKLSVILGVPASLAALFAVVLLIVNNPYA